jgi:hypothetical protein
MPTAYLIWQNPFMTIGGDTFINDLLNCAACKIFLLIKRGTQSQLQAKLKKETAAFLLLSSEPYPFKQQHAEDWGKIITQYKDPVG